MALALKNLMEQTFHRVLNFRIWLGIVADIYEKNVKRCVERLREVVLAVKTISFADSAAHCYAVNRVAQPFFWH